ncbi:MAG: hypothetical protein ACM3RP_10755 [Chitinophagales bacterium]
MPLTPEILDDAFALPWRLFMSEVPTDLLVDDPAVLDAFEEKASGAWDEVLDFLGEDPEPANARLTAMSLLAVRVFSPDPSEREDDWRADFAACWRPEYREEIMAAGDSEIIWNKVCADYRQAAKQGNPVGAAMLKMLEVLRQEGGRLRMAMAGTKAAVLWEDVLRAADATTKVKAEKLLLEFVEEQFATWIGDKPYLLVNSLIWSAPKVVMRLSRRPREKTAIVKAGSEIFSAVLDTHPEAWDKLGDLVKSVVEEESLGALQEAETEARSAVGPDQPSEPALKVTEGEDGEVKIDRVKGSVH